MNSKDKINKLMDLVDRMEWESGYLEFIDSGCIYNYYRRIRNQKDNYYCSLGNFDAFLIDDGNENIHVETCYVGYENTRWRVWDHYPTYNEMINNKLENFNE